MTVTVGTTGYYDITADGAEGGTGVGGGIGGLGAMATGDMYLTAGEKLEIVADGAGGNSTSNGGDGGGGRFVILTYGAGGSGPVMRAAELSPGAN